VSVSLESSCKLLTRWRSQPETLWLKDAPTHPLQQALKDLERAYSNFFAKRADLPRFKKKGRHESFRYPGPKQIKLDAVNSRLFLPKLGWLRYRNSRKVLGAVKNVTVSVSCGKWFVSIQTEREVEQPLPRGGAVGIDLGVVRFATLSDGTFYAPLNSEYQRLAGHAVAAAFLMSHPSVASAAVPLVAPHGIALVTAFALAMPSTCALDWICSNQLLDNFEEWDASLTVRR